MKHLLPALFLLMAVVLNMPVAAHAQNAALAVLYLETEKTPKEGLGFLLSSTGTSQKPDVEIREIGRGKYRLSFVYTPSEIHPDSSASVMVSFTDGTTEFTRTTPVRNEALRAPMVDLAFCPDALPAESKLVTDIGLLESLVDVRKKRVDQSMQQVHARLTPEVLKKLSRLERSFGLDTTPPLSSDMTVEALVDRLYRIVTVAKTFAVHRQVQ